MQFDLFGSSLSMWAWPADEPMPSAPLITAIDSSFTKGEVGIDYFSLQADPMLGNAIFRFVHAADTHISDLAGDYNSDGVVDTADYVVWRKGLGTTYTQTDYDVWRAHFGQTTGNGAALPSAQPLSADVPEPSTLTVVMIFFVVKRFARVCNRNGSK
jgi:hypothetical protein